MTLSLYWKIVTPRYGQHLPITLKWALEKDNFNKHPTLEFLKGFLASSQLSLTPEQAGEPFEALKAVIEALDQGQEVEFYWG